MDVPTLIGGQPNHALLKYMAKVCQRKGRRAGPDEPEELLQDAVVLLLRKAHQFDPARGKPTTFAHFVCNSTQSKRAASYRRRSARVRVGHVTDRPEPRTRRTRPSGRSWWRWSARRWPNCGPTSGSY